uniref:Uncharacterized protein n=1 Tax=Rhizophora mucronata TaxID=61149 RepID=A0A2P2PCX7_RHIMU
MKICLRRLVNVPIPCFLLFLLFYCF